MAGEIKAAFQKGGRKKGSKGGQINPLYAGIVGVIMIIACPWVGLLFSPSGWLQLLTVVAGLAAGMVLLWVGAENYFSPE